MSLSRRPFRSTPRGTLRWLLLGAFLSLAGVAGLASAASSQSGPLPLPKLGALPAPLAGRMEALKRAAEEARGLKFRRAVESGTLSAAEVHRWLEGELAEELPPARLAELRTALAAFGFIPESLDLGRFLPDLLADQIGGFYDTDRKVLVLVRDAAARSGAGPAGDALAATLARQVEEAVLVHELTHALQDQAFHLPEGNPAFFSDREAARDALVEGDATLSMFDFMMGSRLEEQPGFTGMLGSLVGHGSGPGSFSALLSGAPGGESLAAAPPYFQDTLLFSYFQGLAFCAEVRRAGGQKLLDYAFTQDPPRSTEQILHPEKWHAKRDDPLNLAWPDLVRELPGWSKKAEGELGELATAILLRSAAEAPSGSAEAAAAGWGGDRFAVYEQGGKRLLLWLTEWDTPTDAEELAAAAGRLGAGWQVEHLSPTRVALLRGDLPSETRQAVLARLAAAAIERPANRPIDLQTREPSPNR